ncbi:TonB-dependent receptor [Aurantiacibacter xanthus]|uniref:TonB-dependent receptor n=1 Tax=Aurantiacibacter xanthus TaxID=1784712 RepID=A0A3A1NYM4_9SPHN|nr:TonB-dependent receptor [Aurantiacibacter xanthus]RIV80469.1 TonB-dependent receptor [Aurantiacibacter xanthus]
MSNPLSATTRVAGLARVSLLASAASFAGLALLPTAALAQDSDDSSRIVVTGSRVVRDGSNAPTPLSVISGDEIDAEAPANIADFVNTLPSVNGSQTAVSNSGSLSNGKSGISALNLRSLGQSRTLVLLDGQRSVGSTSDGLVDINTFPQALIERVEVVTGGASSVYGSDAVAGVVNFILDKDFTGIKASYEYGVTTYSDVPNHLAQLTLGTEFADGRGHLIVSGEYFNQTGKDFIDRDWNKSGYFMIENPDYAPGNGLPSRIIQSGIGSSNFTPGGLITGCRAGTAAAACPFNGTYFGTLDASTGLASTNELNFGQVSGQWMIGGDYQYASQGHAGSNSLANDEDRIGLFGRLSYEITPSFEVFAQASYNKFEGESFYQQTPSVNVDIAIDNAFLPPELAAEIAAYNATAATPITAIRMGTSNAGIPAAGAHNTREVSRFVVGGNGFFNLAGLDVDWDTYFQHGQTKTDEMLINTWQNSRLAAMQDAVFSGGTIQCRVNTDGNPSNDLPGCVPINRLGVGGVTQQALDYLFEVYPSRQQEIKQDVVALNFAVADLFNTWGGPVSIAFGGEYREDSVDGYIDPVNLNTFLYGNFRVTSGGVNVKEGYVEALVPLGFGAEFNGAVRVTDYSTSGTVTTWKAGLSWQPIDDLRFRGTLSRDIRAPNLLELFDAGTARTNSVNIPVSGGGVRAEEFIERTLGNPSLAPEKADTLGLGVVFTPLFLPGFTASVDYFDIDIKGAVSTITAQQTVDLCFDGSQPELCDLILYKSGSTTDVEYINRFPINFASQKSRGFDFEASYRAPVGPGALTLRGLATYTIENVSDSGFEVDDIAGVNAGGGIPTLVYRVSAGYAFDNGLSAVFVGRGFGDGVYDNDWIACTTGCPASDNLNRTINTNSINGTFYLDSNFTYDFEIGGVEATALFAVKNLFDRDPVLIGNGPFGNNTPAYPQTNRSLYDTMGRTFRLGLSVKY